MKCFEFDLNQLVKISLFGKEHLIPPRAHVARCIQTGILYFVTNGELWLEVNGKEERLRPGDVYIFQNGDIQKPMATTEAKYYYVHFVCEKSMEMTNAQYFDWVGKQDIAFAKLNNHGTEVYEHLKICLMQRIHVCDREILNTLVSRFDSCANSFWSKNQENRLYISASFAQILFILKNICVNAYKKGRNCNTTVYDTVRAVSQYISENFSKDIGRKEIEAIFSVNYDYANRVFHQIMGTSIVRYRNMLRIEYAKLLLATTEKSMMDIADEIGFADKYYFSRYFKKVMGLSPVDYKKRVYLNDL